MITHNYPVRPEPALWYLANRHFPNCYVFINASTGKTELRAVTDGWNRDCVKSFCKMLSDRHSGLFCGDL